MCCEADDLPPSNRIIWDAGPAGCSVSGRCCALHSILLHLVANFLCVIQGAGLLGQCYRFISRHSSILWLFILQFWKCCRKHPKSHLYILEKHHVWDRPPHMDVQKVPCQNTDLFDLSSLVLQSDFGPDYSSEFPDCCYLVVLRGCHELSHHFPVQTEGSAE